MSCRGPLLAVVIAFVELGPEVSVLALGEVQGVLAQGRPARGQDEALEGGVDRAELGERRCALVAPVSLDGTGEVVFGSWPAESARVG